MSNWTYGYVADVTYTHGFYRELTPSLLSIIALARGQHGPGAATPLTYCELGCGQGFSMNLLAAANPHIRFHATDFNPSQVAGARVLAAEAGLSNITFHDQSFADFADAPDLPESFDIIALHGIYSWISAENRAAIVEFIRRKLKVGGLAYVSYNCLPGWAAGAPMRHLLYVHGKTTGGPTAQRLPPALDFLDTLQKANAGFFQANPGTKERLARVRQQNHSYLAHEYLNDDWNLFYHSQVAGEMAGAKLTYLGSAAPLEQVDAINLTPEQSGILAGLGDAVLRETVRDFMTNAQFRKDVFVKGPLPLTARVAREAWLASRFALVTPREFIEFKVRGSRGEAKLEPTIYGPILDALAAGPQTLADLVKRPEISGIGWSRLQEALVVSIGSGHVQPCLPAKGEDARRKATRAFNAAVLQHAIDSADLQFLASPVTGGGIMVSRFQQLFLLAMSEGRKLPDEWAARSWEILNGQGQRIIKDGKTMEGEEENLAELKSQAQTFSEKMVPLLKSLQIV